MNKKEKPLLLFVHGGAHGAWCWKKHFIPFFEEKHGYPCYALSLSGHETPGNTEKHINHIPFQTYVDDLKSAVRKHENEYSPREGIILIGHSMGTMVIQKYLETDPAYKVVLLAPIPPKGVLHTTTTQLSQFRGLLPNIFCCNLLGGIHANAKSMFFSGQSFLIF